MEQAKKEESHSVQDNFRRVIKPFVTASMEALSSLGELEEITFEKPFVLKGGRNLGIDISGMIAVLSPEFRATVYVSFPEASFLKIVGTMIGEDLKEINDDVKDAASEIANIILGNAKKELGEMGIQCEFTLPSVITGNSHTVHVNAESTNIIVPFQSEVGGFYLQICLPLGK